MNAPSLNSRRSQRSRRFPCPDLRELIFSWKYGLIPVPLKEAGVAKLADAPDLGSGGEILRGSSPLSGKSLGIKVLC
jgi:hypothetical protein